MKNIENTMETNVKIIHRLILSWGPFEAHLRFRWGYFESPLRLLLTASLDVVHKSAFELILKEFKGFTENDKKNMRGQFE